MFGKLNDLEWGLYVHWPFCASKCPYCDFNSHVRGAVDQARWRAALIRDVEHAGKRAGRANLKSIFFGGGTPSLMPVETVAAVIDAAHQTFDVSSATEITLEANPSSAEASNFQALADAGVNRLSLGVQSFDDECLKFLGRAHGADEARRAIEAAQQAVARVSFDLIYALPDQSKSDWQAQLREALLFGTEHLSVYQLTIEPNTGFQGQVSRGVFTPLDDDLSTDLYEITQDVLGAAGLPAYETSNHARYGAACQHNLVYWRGLPYAAIGPGAHGRWLTEDGWTETAALKKPERWLDAMEQSGKAFESDMAVAPKSRAEEILMTALRLDEGADLDQISALAGFEARRLVDARALQDLGAQGLLTADQDRVTLSARGRQLANSVLAYILKEDEAFAD